MDLSTCYCRNCRCDYSGLVGKASRLQLDGWHHGAQRLQCAACGHHLSARTGTGYAGIQTPEPVYQSGIRQLAEGTAIRATARNTDCDKDTVAHWLRVVGRHCLRVHQYFFRDLHLTECQLDELWTFVYKKEAHLTAFEKLAGLYGDAWIWIAFDPVHKLVPVWVVGKRTLVNAKKLIKRLKNRLDGHIPFFTSDELPHYAEALLAVYGVWVTPPRRFPRGRSPAPRLQAPSELVYAVVIKHRERGRVVSVTTQVVFGTQAAVAACLKASPVSTTISTYGVERNNLTVRQHSRRLGRKVNAFSKAHRYLNYQLALSFAYYHFCRPHRGLRRKLKYPIPTQNGRGSPKKWQPVTPAMAARLTDHVWTIDELLSFRVPPPSMWKKR
jgi:IS1 family transposase/transposase-like protein